MCCAGVKEEIDELINKMAELSKAGKFEDMMQFYADEFRFGSSPSGWIINDKNSEFTQSKCVALSATLILGLTTF